MIHLAVMQSDAKTLRAIVERIEPLLDTQGAGLYFEPIDLSVIYLVATGQIEPVTREGGVDE